MMGSKKSKDPREEESRGWRTKFDIKKQGACSSTGIAREVCPCIENTLIPESETGETRYFESSAMSSSSVFVKTMSSFWVREIGEIGEMGFFFGNVPRLALRSVAFVSFRKTISKSSLYPGH